MASKLVKYIANGLTALVLAAAGGAFAQSILEQGTHERAWRAAAKLADKKGDHNYIINEKEYASIYNALGLKDTGRYALDLSTSQLENYVSQNR